ncbi:putative claspin [Apostichopus japonicus]|uniref:Putative claspin n=1 Tax=Stichopus japonicus TaxID=307972 RepID=A0A2G8JH32_STIJA|nr:putative claspin [Apostichopus japonicus]
MAYNIDNEEMGGGEGEEEEEEEEEEAELSDGDMSDEEYRMGAEVDSEEDDEDFNPDDEIVREKHMFADDEAEDDDDEDSEGEVADDNVRKVESNSQKKMTPKPSDGNEDSGDEISPQSRKTKASSKRRILLSDDEDDEDDDFQETSEIKSQIIHQAPKETVKIPDIHQETSTLSSSSSKTSSVKKSDSSSVTHYFPDVGKTMDLFDSTSSLTDDIKNNDLTSDDKQTTFNLKEHLGRQDSVTSKTSEADNNSVTSLDNSFEMFPATIPPYQPRRESLDDSDDLKSKENFMPFSKAKISLNTAQLSTSKFPELSLPVEDSQDLFQMDTPSLMMPDSQRETETQNFRFSFDEDETQTQFLDGNGFLKLKSSAKRPGPRKIFQTENASEGNMDELLGLCSGQFNQDDARSGKVFHNENASQGNMDELLGLCSGRFSKQDDTDSPKVYKNEVNTQGNMNELLGLCSGQFKEDREDKEGTPRVLQSQTSFRKGLFSQMKSQDNVSELIGLCSGNFSSQLEEDKIDKSMQKESSDKDSESSFSLVFDQETLKEELREDKQEEDGESSDDEPIILTRKKKPVTKQKEEEDELLLAYDSEDELEVNRNAFKGKTYSKFAKKKFFEQEAELSGSDADSDEDYDAEEEPDELELDREVEEQFKDTEELREQVNEIHMKATDDEDARRLRLFKELYLRDGDLHSEKSRVRRFRWKHLDEMEMDGGGGGNGDSEDEGAEEDDQDTQWRLQRYQREQWLKEQDKETGQKEATEEPPPVLVEDEDSQFPLSMKIVSRNNSKAQTWLLPQRKKQELEKLASVVKPLANITRPKNNRGFIFQSLSQTNMETEKLIQPSKVKRSISVQGTSGQHLEGPQSKKPKLERSVSQTSSGSIFNHF